MLNQKINPEKIQVLYEAAARRKRRMEVQRDDIRAIAADMAHLQKSLSGLTGTDDRRAGIDQKIVEMAAKRTKLESEQTALQEEFNEILRLRDSCTAYLEQQGIPVPENIAGTRSTRGFL